MPCPCCGKPLKWLVCESYSCVTVCSQGPKLHCFQACRFRRKKKKSQKKTRLRLFQLPTKGRVIGVPQVEIRQLLKFYWRLQGTCPQVSWVAGRQVFPLWKDWREILSLECLRERFLERPLELLIWGMAGKLVTWFPGVHCSSLSPNDGMILGESLSFPECHFCHL